MIEFIADYLGPSLDENIGIWLHDGQKIELSEIVLPFLLSDRVIKYVSGIGMHWYLEVPPTDGCPRKLCSGSFAQIGAMFDTLQRMNHSNIFMINTEACTGFNVIESPPVRGVSLGDWKRGMQIAEDIIGDISHGLSGWVDWNLLLDADGGPNHRNNSCDAPIVVDFANNVYYKQPMYYHIAHISRFVLRDSHRINISESDGNSNEHLWIMAVKDEKNLDKTVIVLMNTDGSNPLQIEIYDPRKGYLQMTLPPHSIQTILYAN